MDLKQDTRCYTDVCVNGLWYHYDHCTTHAYILKGGASSSVQLKSEPKTEEELIHLLQSLNC
ncbi:hypothetical protein [Vibrio astriarenae]|uniref:hypothetical protein n=1 Tax=Vibrio astriarenae TaxID=1481923 RepID=UPI0037369A5D